MSFLLVLLIRLLIPLSIFRFPLLGGVLSIAADLADWHILQMFQPLSYETYQQVDKMLDLYYLSIEAYMVHAWTSQRLRWTAWGLFSWRVMGVLLFAATQQQWLLMLFPNVFEYFYLFILLYQSATHHVFSRSKLQLTLACSGIGVIKIVQEYVMHVSRFPYWRYLNWWEWIR